MRNLFGRFLVTVTLITFCLTFELGSSEFQGDEEALIYEDPALLDFRGSYKNFPVQATVVDLQRFIPMNSSSTLRSLMGTFVDVDFPDLKFRSSDYVRKYYPQIFDELPEEGFDLALKNPCWKSSKREGNLKNKLECLPYAYVLGQPKCGTSDLYERMKKHDSIIMPTRKEVRWFTRGEFMTKTMIREGADDDVFDDETSMRNEKQLGPASSIYSFTRSFLPAARKIGLNRRNDSSLITTITVDGGPHTFWWPTQSPEGQFLNEDVPPPQLLREIQPDARLIVTLSDPVKRMYSDYYFLDDSMKPVRPGDENSKSAEQFHERVKAQIDYFNTCIDSYMDALGNQVSIDSSGDFSGLIKDYIPSEYADKFPLWFRASQMCAHDRKHFARAGFGRIAIGMYVLFLEKWLEHFPLNQFLFVRLEDFETSPKDYMLKIFDFLGVGEPSKWKSIIDEKRFNEHNGEREPLLEETETLLRNFYRPYNELLAQIVKDPGYLWKLKVVDGVEVTLRSKQLAKLSEIDADSKDNGTNEQAILKINPKAFNIDDLLPVESVAEEFINRKFDQFSDPNQVSQMLCKAAFRLDIPVLKHLLYDTGVPASAANKFDNLRNAFHCLPLITNMADAHPSGHTFSLLKGETSWVTPKLSIPLEEKMSSVLARRITESLSPEIVKTAQWLHRAGVPFDSQDRSGYTPLHYAAEGGLKDLVKFLLDLGANPNTLTVQDRSPLHLAAAWGHAEISGLLINAGADANLADHNGVTAMDIFQSPGPIVPADALKFLNVTQRGPRKIERLVNPELHTDDEKLGWSAGPGGYDPARLQGFETDLSCDADQYFADEIDGEQIFRQYMARNSPVLIRGLLKNWTITSMYAWENLKSEFGRLKVDVSDIPYAQKFGGGQKKEMRLKEYMEAIQNHSIVGGKYPWYVFRAHPIPDGVEDRDSLIPYENIPLPDALETAFRLGSVELTEDEDLTGEDFYKAAFVNAQWAFGGAGTGAPIHFHNGAWNAIIYGAKKWFIYPPHDMTVSNMQIREYYEKDLHETAKFGANLMTCVQTAGDVMFIPESWGHGVMNIQDSVAIATEVRSGIWRSHPGASPMRSGPDGRGRGRGGQGRGREGPGRGAPPPGRAGMQGKSVPGKSLKSPPPPPGGKGGRSSGGPRSGTPAKRAPPPTSAARGRQQGRGGGRGPPPKKAPPGGGRHNRDHREL